MSTCRPREQSELAHCFDSALSEPMPAADWPVELTGFRGALDQIGLPSVLWVLEMERKTGILVLIVEPELEKAYLHLSGGRVFRAQLDQREEPRNAELVCDLLARTRGIFDFRPEEVMPDDEMKCSTTWLILEAARRIDEARLAPFPKRPAVRTHARSGHPSSLGPPSASDLSPYRPGSSAPIHFASHL